MRSLNSIDGSYCGIDESQIDASHKDLDEGVKMEDLSSWFENACVQSANVEYQEKSHRIYLTLQYDNQLFRLVCDGDSHHCSFERVDSH